MLGDREAGIWGKKSTMSNRRHKALEEKQQKQKQNRNITM